MKINSKDFRVQEGEKVKLKKWPTLAKPVYKSREQYQDLLGEQVEERCGCGSRREGAPVK